MYFDHHSSLSLHSVFSTTSLQSSSLSRSTLSSLIRLYSRLPSLALLCLLCHVSTVVFPLSLHSVFSATSLQSSSLSRSQIKTEVCFNFHRLKVAVSQERRVSLQFKVIFVLNFINCRLECTYSLRFDTL